MARQTATSDAILRSNAGPLSHNSLTIHRQSLKETLRGGRYTGALKNDDTGYLLTLIGQPLRQPAQRTALQSLDQHITNDNAQGTAARSGARAVHDRWMQRPGRQMTPAKTGITATLAREFTALAAAAPIPKTSTASAAPTPATPFPSPIPPCRVCFQAHLPLEIR